MATRVAAALAVISVVAYQAAPAPVRAATSQPATQYRVGPQDVVEVVVFAQPDLTAKYTVGSDGAFSFPLIGEVKAAGLTAREIEADIRARLADGYLRNPEVSVRIAEYRSQRR
jgi:polysaccharide export outer membrane protein